MLQQCVIVIQNTLQKKKKKMTKANKNVYKS